MIANEVPTKMTKKNTLIYCKPNIINYNSIFYSYLSEIINLGESFIFTDPEDLVLSCFGEKLVQNRYNVISINLRKPSQSNAWNPLQMPYQAYIKGEMDLCIDLLNDIAINIMADTPIDVTPVKSEDPFWTLSAIDLFVGFSLILFKEAQNNASQININSVYYMGLKGFEKFGNSTIIKEYFDRINVEFNNAAKAVSTILTAPTDTRNSILSVFLQKMRVLTFNVGFTNILSNNDIDLNSLVNEKTAFFLCYEDEKNNTSFVNIFIRQIFELLIKKRTNEKMKHSKFHIIWNNFLSLGKFPNLDRLLLSSSSRNINLVFDISSINLLNKLYDKNTGALILSLCSMWIIFSTREIEMLQHIELLLQLSKLDVSLVNKTPYTLEENEFMFFEDGKPPEILYLTDFETVNYSYEHKPLITQCVSSNNIFLFDKFIKERLQEKLFSPNQSTQVHEDEFDVDELITRIDRKIAALEIEDKFEQAKASNIQGKKQQ